LLSVTPTPVPKTFVPTVALSFRPRQPPPTAIPVLPFLNMSASDSQESIRNTDAAHVAVDVVGGGSAPVADQPLVVATFNVACLQTNPFEFALDQARFPLLAAGVDTFGTDCALPLTPLRTPLPISMILDDYYNFGTQVFPVIRSEAVDGDKAVALFLQRFQHMTIAQFVNDKSIGEQRMLSWPDRLCPWQKRHTFLSGDMAKVVDPAYIRDLIARCAASPLPPKYKADPEVYEAGPGFLVLMLLTFDLLVIHHMIYTCYKPSNLSTYAIMGRMFAERSQLVQQQNDPGSGTEHRLQCVRRIFEEEKATFVGVQECSADMLSKIKSPLTVWTNVVDAANPQNSAIVHDTRLASFAIGETERAFRYVQAASVENGYIGKVGDLAVGVYRLSDTGQTVLVASFHGSNDKEAKCVGHAVAHVAGEMDLRAVFLCDANTKTNTWQRFHDEMHATGWNADDAFVAAAAPTTRKQRTPMQPQFHKAMEVCAVPKDTVLGFECDISSTKLANAVSPEGALTFDEAQRLPHSNWTSDHSAVIAAVTLHPDATDTTAS